MTKRDYDTIAACIGAAKAYPNNCKDTVADIAQRLIVELSLDNPRFDSLKFCARVEHWRKSHGGS